MGLSLFPFPQWDTAHFWGVVVGHLTGRTGEAGPFPACRPTPHSTALPRHKAREDFGPLLWLLPPPPSSPGGRSLWVLRAGCPRRGPAGRSALPVGNAWPCLCPAPCVFLLAQSWTGTWQPAAGAVWAGRGRDLPRCREGLTMGFGIAARALVRAMRVTELPQRCEAERS